MCVWVTGVVAVLCILTVRVTPWIAALACILQGEAATRREPPSLLFSSGLFILKSVRVCCVCISSPVSLRRRKQRRPRSCRPWLQSLGCTGSPGVTGPLLEGIQLAKRRRSPVFNNNHLKSLQLARSYKEMESRKMCRRRREGGKKGYKLRFSEPFECQLLFHMENSRGPLCSSIISHES